MSKNRLTIAALSAMIALSALLVLACSTPPAGPTAAEIRAIVKEEVGNVPAPAAAPAGPSAQEIQKLVETAVMEASASDVEPLTSAEVESIVAAAVSAIPAPPAVPPSVPAPAGPSADEIQKLVETAIMEAAENEAEPLSASEVEAIVASAIAAIPTPEAMMVMSGPSGDPIKIGTILDYTGDLGAYGPPMRNGVDIAAELINEAGGILGRPVEPVHKDGGTSAQVATDSGNALVAEGAEVIIGALGSGFSIALANSVTVPNEIVQITPASTSPALTVLDDNDFLFRTAVSDATQGVILARLARELGYETAAALYVNNAYGEGLARVFEENFEAEGGTITALVPQESDQPTYLSELENAVEGDPDVLVAMSYPVSSEVYLREAIEGEYINTFLFVDGNKQQSLFDSLGVDNFEGSYGTAPGTQESDSSKVFQVLYEERYGQFPVNPFIGETFDAMAIAALAIEKAGEYDGPAVRDAMREVANAPGIKVGPGDFAKALDLIRRGEDIDYEGIAGSQNFDENGDVLNTIEIWKIEDGKIVSSGRFETP